MNPKKIENNRDIFQKVADMFNPPIRESRMPFSVPFEVDGKTLSWKDEGIVHTTYRVDLFGNRFDEKTTIEKPQFVSFDKDGKPNFYKVKPYGAYGAPQIYENGAEEGKNTGNVVPTVFIDQNSNEIFVLTEIDPEGTQKTGQPQRRAVRASNDNVVTGHIVNKSMQDVEATMTPIAPGAVRKIAENQLTNSTRIVGAITTGGVYIPNRPNDELLNKVDFDPKDKVQLKALPLAVYLTQSDMVGKGAVLNLLGDMMQQDEIKVSASLPTVRI